MAHLLTNFYLDFQDMGLPTADQEAFRKWAIEKLDRDYLRKIFFEEEKELVKVRYHELKQLWSG